MLGLKLNHVSERGPRCADGRVVHLGLIRPNLPFNSNLTESRLPIPYFSFIQSCVILTTCSVYDIKMISQLKRMLRTNVISRDLSFRWVSDRYPISQHRSHYNDVIMSERASPITGVSCVCSTVVSGTDQRKHQGSASLIFVRGIHRWPVNSLHKRAVTRRMIPFDDVIMQALFLLTVLGGLVHCIVNVDIDKISINGYTVGSVTMITCGAASGIRMKFLFQCMLCF